MGSVRGRTRCVRCGGLRGLCAALAWRGPAARHHGATQCALTGPLLCACAGRSPDDCWRRAPRSPARNKSDDHVLLLPWRGIRGLGALILLACGRLREKCVGACDPETVATLIFSPAATMARLKDSRRPGRCVVPGAA